MKHPIQKDPETFAKLLKMVDLLRAPDGCPWDKSRTIPQLKEDLLEECQEIAEAIENKDWDNLEEELGDMLFGIALVIQIAKEEKLFSAESVIKRVSEKIIERHTWVFGNDTVSTPEEAVELWKKNKTKQKKKVNAFSAKKT